MVGRVRPGSSRRKLEARLDDLLRSNARLQQSLNEHRDRQADVIGALNHQASAVERLSRDVATLATTLGTASGETAQALQRLHAGHQAVRATTETLASKLRHRSDASHPAVVAGDKIVATLIDGFIVGVPGEDWRLAAHHALRGMPEPGLTKRFSASLQSGMVVVDVGAGVGIFTLYAARLAGAYGKVFSFESDSRAFALLQDNIQVNGFAESGNVVSHSMAVEATNLDLTLADVPRVDVVKISAGGDEPVIWDRMTEILRRSPHIRVFISFAPKRLKRAGHDPEAFLNHVSGSGFAIDRIDDQTGALSELRRSHFGGESTACLMLHRSGR